MERWLTGVTGTGIEGDFVNRPRSCKSLWILSIGIVLNYQWVVEEGNLVTVGAEEEKARE